LQNQFNSKLPNDKKPLNYIYRRHDGDVPEIHITREGSKSNVPAYDFVLKGRLLVAFFDRYFNAITGGNFSTGKQFDVRQPPHSHCLPSVI